jgi:hypothetical protein
VNAGVLSGKKPRGPPPDSYTVKDMVRFLRSFSSDHDGIDLGDLRPSDPDHQNDMQIRKILSEMDGSLGWVRLDRTDINDVIRRWELDAGYTMNGRGF